MRKSWGIAVVLALAAAAFWFFYNAKKPTAANISPLPQITPSAQSAVSSSNTLPIAPFTPSAIPASNSPGTIASPSQNAQVTGGTAGGTPDSSQTPQLEPLTVLQNVRRSVRQFGEMFGGNPVGTNPEITSQLSGHNPKHINFIDAQAGMRVNANGEMVDPWGTPYFFHQLSATEMEIHSAGPDKQMWTSDDLVVK